MLIQDYIKLHADSFAENDNGLTYIYISRKNVIWLIRYLGETRQI